MNERDWGLIQHSLTGGAAVGGSLALLTSLLNHYKRLQRRSVINDPNREDDDTMTLYLPGQKAASVAGGLALTGSVLGGTGAYMLFRHLYQQAKRKQVQSDLDDAQKAYLQLLMAPDDKQQKKVASIAPEGRKPMGLGEAALALPIGLPILLGLASAAVTNQALNKTFPGKREPSRRDPRRVVIRRAPVEEEVTPEEEKLATEFMARSAWSLRKQSGAPGTGFEDVLSAFGRGRFREVAQAWGGNPEMAFDLCKGASDTRVQPLRKTLAMEAYATPNFGPFLTMVTASDFYDSQPNLCKMAQAMDEEDQVTLIKVAAEWGRAARLYQAGRYVPEGFRKTSAAMLAAAAPGIAGQLLDMLGSESTADVPMDAAEGEEDLPTDVVVDPSMVEGLASEGAPGPQGLTDHLNTSNSQDSQELAA